jgi:hypothetical protein
MLKRLRNFALSLGMFSLLAVPLAVPVAVSADTISQGLACGSNFTTTGSGDCATTTDKLDVPGVMTLIINIFSIIVGFVAVVMIIIGGVKYITSGGDSSNISGAKNTIVYAIIGLIVVALAQVLVHFVLNKLNNASA